MKRSAHPRLLYIRLPSLLTSRLFLNLKSYTKTKPGFTTISRSIPSLAFAGAGGQQQHDRILGNIGAPLRTWFDDDDDEVELEESAADELSGAAPCDEETGGREVEIVPVVSYLVIFFSSHRLRQLPSLTFSLHRCTAHRERLKSYPWLLRVILPVFRRERRKTRLIRRPMSNTTLKRRFK